MKILIIGGTGHLGSFLTPMLAADGHDLLVVTSGRKPLPEGVAARPFTLSYHESVADGSLAALLQAERPPVVVDILQGETDAVYAACVSAGVAHLVNCGSLWMWGRPQVVPTPGLPQTECPFEGYRNRLADLQRAIARVLDEAPASRR